MRGPTVTASNKSTSLKVMLVTPDLAMKYLDANKHNRPLSQQHANRIAAQIRAGKWKFNGDTIKIASTGDVLDGQHRLWAVVDTGMSIETIVVEGIEPDAFSTIDTIRKTRTGGDTLSLSGVVQYRSYVANALSWLLRYQSNALPDWRLPENKIENSDLEEAFKNHSNMIRAVERCMSIRHICNPSVMACMYYIMSNQNEDLAERMIETMHNPAGVSATDAFFQLRTYFISTRTESKVTDPLVSIACIIKAANSAKKKKPILSKLKWRNQSKSPEPFPILEI